MTVKEIDNLFAHHPPKDEATVAQHEAIRKAGRIFAKAIIKHTPPSADQTAAVRKAREAVMTANAAIACAPA